MFTRIFAVWLSADYIRTRDAAAARDALTATGTSAARLYRESFASLIADTRPVPVPAAARSSPADICRPARRLAQPWFTGLRYWNEPAMGGHLAALEQPTASGPPMSGICGSSCMASPMPWRTKLVQTADSGGPAGRSDRSEDVAYRPLGTTAAIPACSA